MADDLLDLDATAQAECVRRGDVSPRELTDAAIARIERLDPTLNAVILPAFEAARERAAAPLPDGPFRGVPFLMKDLGGPEAGRRYTAGMRCLKDAGWSEPTNAYLVDKLLAAGLVILGRTNTPELGLMPTTEPAAWGATRNPWNLAHSPGGSSGGSAAAVAAGMVAAAHASDGGGSIRIPASMCGLVGLKPTRGRNSFGPGTGERWAGLSAEFVVTRSVRDAAALLDVTCGPMPGDPYAAAPPAQPYAQAIATPPGALRIGLMRTPPRDRGIELHPECRAAAEQTARTLEGLGHVVEEAHPEALDDPGGIMHFVGLVAASIARALDAAAEKLGRPLTPDDVEPLTWAIAERGRAIRAAAYIGHVDAMHAYGRRLAAWWETGFDLLLTPGTAQPPPPLGYLQATPDSPFGGFMRAAAYGAYTTAFNLSGQPGISIPAAWSADGLPLGAQLVAASGREDLLLQVAAQIETAAPWRDRRPPR